MVKKQKKKLLIRSTTAGIAILGLFSIFLLKRGDTETLNTETKEETKLRGKNSFEGKRENQKNASSFGNKTEEAVTRLYNRAGLDSNVSSTSKLTYQELQEISTVKREKKSRFTPIIKQMNTADLSDSQSNNPNHLQKQVFKKKDNEENLQSKLPVFILNEPEENLDPVPLPPASTVMIDYLSLQEILEEADTHSEEAYLSYTYQVLQTEIEVGKNMLVNQNSSQEEIDAQVIRIQQAIQKLIFRGDRTKLADFLKQIQQFNLSFYTTTSVNNFNQAYEQAVAILKIKEAPQEVFDQQINHLKQAIKHLIKRGEKTELIHWLSQVQQIDREIYTAESLRLFDDVIDRIGIVLNDIDAVQNQIDQAIDDLCQGHDHLEKVEEPYLSLIYLKRLITDFEQLDSSIYTISSFEQFELVLNQAKEMASNLYVDESQVQEQLLVLQQVKDQLVRKAEKTVLLQLVTEISQLKEEQYTAESWLLLQATLMHTNEVLADDDVSQEKIDETVIALEIAKNSLLEQNMAFNRRG